MMKKPSREKSFTEENDWKKPPVLLKEGHYVISSHADVTRALLDPRFSNPLVFSPSNTGMSTSCPWLRVQQFFSPGKQSCRSTRQIHDLIKHSFVYLDEEEHGRFQQPIKKVFFSRLQSIQPFLASTSQQHLKHSIGKTSQWNDSVIYPYITEAFEILFDFPEKPDPGLYEWIRPKAIGMLFSHHPDPSKECYRSFLKAIAFIETCMASPRLNETKGLIAGITGLSESPTSFTKDEICGNLLVFLIASTFSVPRFLAGSLRTLIERADLLKQLQENNELIPSAVQEFLRVNGPVKKVCRQINKDLAIRNVLLKKGDWIDLDLEKANHDPLVFEKPEQILFKRNPNPHLALGAGLHYCLGAPMARLLSEAFLMSFVKQSASTRFLKTVPGHGSPSLPDELWVRAMPLEGSLDPA